MKSISREQAIRLTLAVVILLSGVAMIPFVDLPAGAIGWEMLAGIYAPDLSVNETSGAPGSTFAFTGTGYPSNSTATVYVNGETLGSTMTDALGKVTFTLNTTGASTGQYNVTLEVDINASATQSIELVESGSIINPPDGFDGPKFYLGSPIFLPVIFLQF